MAHSIAYVEFQKWWLDYRQKMGIPESERAQENAAWYAWVAAVTWAAPRHKTAWESLASARSKARRAALKAGSSNG